MLTDKIALLLRVGVLYPLAGLLAALPSVSFDEAAGILTVDVTAASVAIGALVWTGISTGTFGWSRWVKKIGGLV